MGYENGMSVEMPFSKKGKAGGGCDKKETLVTKFMQEGIEIHYEDDSIPSWMLEAYHEKSLVVIHRQFPKAIRIEIFLQNGFHVYKRADAGLSYSRC